MAVIIEVRRRGGQLIERCRCEGDQIRIGRAFDNDVIVDDPFVSEHHLELQRCEAGWQIIDLGSVNGYRIKSNQRLAEPDSIQSGESVRIGQVTLQLFQTDHQVPPAAKINGIERQLKVLGWHRVWPVVLVSVLGLILLDGYLKVVTEIKPLDLLNVVVGQLVVIGGFALLWGLAGRIFRHKLRFSTYLSLWAIYTLLSIYADNIAGVIGYNLNSGIASTVISLLLNAVLLIAVVWSCLSLASNLRPKGRIWSAVSASVVVLFLQSFDMVRFQQHYSALPNYYGALKPPVMSWAPAQSSRDLEQMLDKLYSDAQQEAEEELD